MNVERITRGTKIEIRIKAEQKKALVQHLKDLKVLDMIEAERTDVTLEDLISSIVIDYVESDGFKAIKEKAEAKRKEAKKASLQEQLNKANKRVEDLTSELEEAEGKKEEKKEVKAEAEAEAEA